MKKINSKKDEFEVLLENLSQSIQTSIQSFYPQKLGIDPEDLSQEIKIKLWKIFKSDKKILNYSSYIKRVINSIVIDEIRISRRHQKIVDIEKKRYLQDQRMSNVPIMIRKEVDLAFNSIKEPRRTVVRWSLLGLNINEISKILNINETKTTNLLYRGMNDLKNILKFRGIEYED